MQFNTSFNDLMIGGYRYQLNQGSHQAERNSITTPLSATLYIFSKTYKVDICSCKYNYSLVRMKNYAAVAQLVDAAV